MTDRELLEMAAKAAGIEWLGWLPGKVDAASLSLAPNGRIWNPLTDDGDALRLTVKLFLEIRYDMRGLCVGVTQNMDDGWDYVEEFTDDPSAATRRAIVRAAAEIGKAMP